MSQEAVTAHKSKAHYLPLDSIRGIAALSVVVHHFVTSKVMIAAFPQKAWIDIPFFHNAWLFVDLFFVLSGMVISLSYVKADFGHFSFREFASRRLARIYPLHVVMLVMMLVLRLARLALVASGMLAAAAPGIEVNTIYSFVLNLLLLHSLGFLDHLSWNGPSWSISTEFYTYLLFGALLLLAQQFRSLKFFYLVSAVLVVGSWILAAFGLGKPSLDFHYDFGLVRCILSFFIGVLTVRLVSAWPRPAMPIAPSVLQWILLAAAISIVMVVGAYPEISFVAPFVFALLLGSLMAFPVEASLPRLLATAPLVWLGKRSYSIYMVHAAVLVLAEYAVRAIGSRPYRPFDASSAGSATVALCLFVLCVLIASSITYRYVEVRGGRLLLRILGGNNRLPLPVTAKIGNVPN